MHLLKRLGTLHPVGYAGGSAVHAALSTFCCYVVQLYGRKWRGDASGADGTRRGLTSAVSYQPSEAATFRALNALGATESDGKQLLQIADRRAVLSVTVRTRARFPPTRGDPTPGSPCAARRLGSATRPRGRDYSYLCCRPVQAAKWRCAVTRLTYACMHTIRGVECGARFMCVGTEGVPLLQRTPASVRACATSRSARLLQTTPRRASLRCIGRIRCAVQIESIWWRARAKSLVPSKPAVSYVLGQGS